MSNNDDPQDELLDDWLTNSPAVDAFLKSVKVTNRHNETLAFTNATHADIRSLVRSCPADLLSTAGDGSPTLGVLIEQLSKSGVKKARFAGVIRRSKSPIFFVDEVILPRGMKATDVADLDDLCPDDIYKHNGRVHLWWD